MLSARHFHRAMDKAIQNTRVLVILVESKEKIIIPLKWVHNESSDLSWIINWGIKRSRDRKIFFSNNENDEPNFGLAMRAKLCYTEAACYKARIIKSFGKGKFSII